MISSRRPLLGARAFLLCVAALLLVAAAPGGGYHADADRQPETVPTAGGTDAPTEPAVPAPPARSPIGTAVLVALGAVAGGVLGWLVGRRSERDRRLPLTHPRQHLPEQAADPQPQPTQPQEPTVGLLVEGLISSYDLATNDAQRARLRETLRRADVSPIEPEPLTLFDPEQHHALGVEPVDDDGHIGCIARVERPGWRRGNDLLRPPEVIVYRPESTPA